MWELATGNKLGITPEAYKRIVAQKDLTDCLDRELSSPAEDPPEQGGEPEREPEPGSVKYWARAIITDLPRTHSVLAFFHKGGPLQRPAARF